ncbi:hypothetical protein D770_03480 [Flammeovirgaceae bacterium 311]|nr:hypothetical protein D770_03480 [Flammeovirgaceae bacterium 311]
MNRQKLTELIQYPERINTRDISMLTEMAEQYPYATAIQILLAKSKQQQPDARQSLATAALYSPNRGVLRQVMENTLPPLSSSSPAISPAAATTDLQEDPPALPADTTSQDPQQSVPAEQADNRDKEPDEMPAEEISAADRAVQDKADVFEELQKNLRRLREERSRWHTNPKPHSTTQSPGGEGTKGDQNPQAVAGTAINHVPTTLQQIIEDHQEQPLENPRIQAQRSLIDSFLENGGNLQRRQQLQGPPSEEITDLTQNTSYTPQDLATETLAKIMERQGKIDKALDIYQKLSLKYPQKSAYFANCIERLKKDS